MRFPTTTSDKIVQVSAWTDANLGYVNYIDFAAKIDGSNYIALPPDSFWDQTSPSAQFITLVNKSDKTRSLLMNLENGKSFLISSQVGNGLYRRQENQDYSSYFFTRDSSAYVFSVFDSSG